MAASGSGEHALRHLLGPFAIARKPLHQELHELKVGLGPCWPSVSCISTSS